MPPLIGTPPVADPPLKKQRSIIPQGATFARRRPESDGEKKARAPEYLDDEEEDEGSGSGDNAVPDERIERIALHHLEKEGDAQESEEGGGGDADKKGHDVAGRNACLEKLADLEDGGPGDDGEGDEKRETGGGFAVKAEKQRGRDGDTRAGDPRKQRKALEQPDYDGVLQGNFVYAPFFRPRGIGEGEQQAEEDEEPGDDGGAVAEDLLDGTFQRLPRDRCGDGGDQDVKRHPPGGGVQAVAAGGEEVSDQFDDVAPEIERYGEEGSDVQRHVEGEPGGGPVHELRNQNEMCGAADRKNFGEALYGAQNCGLDGIHH